MLNIDDHRERSIGPGGTPSWLRRPGSPTSSTPEVLRVGPDGDGGSRSTDAPGNADPGGTATDGTTTYFLPTSGGSAVTTQSRSPSGLLIDLPIITRHAFDPRKVCATAGYRRLAELRPADVIEVTTITVSDGRDPGDAFDGSSGADDGLTVELVARMLRTAVTENHRIWLIAPEDPLIHFLGSVAGPGLVARVGHRTFGSRRNASPWGLNPVHVSLTLLEVTPDDERHWVAVTLRNVLDGVQVGPRRLARELTRRGVTAARPGLGERLLTTGRHSGQHRQWSRLADVSWGRGRRDRYERRLRDVLVSDSVIDRVDVDRGEIQVL